jgi:protein-tyrosine phosphatase
MRRALVVGLTALALQQIWRHGSDYVFPEKFAVVEPGRLYRGAWQKDWPMRQIVRDHKVKTILALAHPADSPLSVEEKSLAEELGVRWVHIPIVDQRGTNDAETISDLLDQAAAVLADPASQPVYFHCHHGINRTSMVQMAYRTRYCGWTLEEATEEISRTFGLVRVDHGPDYRHMKAYYEKRVLPARERERAEAEAKAKAEPQTQTQAKAEASATTPQPAPSSWAALPVETASSSTVRK